MVYRHPVPAIVREAERAQNPNTRHLGGLEQQNETRIQAENTPRPMSQCHEGCTNPIRTPAQERAYRQGLNSFVRAVVGASPAEAAMNVLPLGRGANLLKRGLEALRGAGRGGESIVYRGLAKGENPAAGLTARNPDAGNNIASHVGGARNSQWISTTKDKAIAQERFGQHGVVAVDLSRVNSRVVDLSGGIPGLDPNFMLSRWAANAQEVVIQGRVPPQAIVR